MAGMIVDTGRLKVYENLRALGSFAGVAEAFIDDLWMELLTDRELYEEMCYYMAHRTFLDRVSYAGYTLCDLFIWQMSQDNLLHDTGKNTAECNKEAMVLKAFDGMIKLKQNPEEWSRKLSAGEGMDR